MANEGLFVAVAIITTALVIGWIYPQRTKRLLDTSGKVIKAFYLLLGIVFAGIFITSGMFWLVVLGALILASIALQGLYTTDARDKFTKFKS